MAEQKDSPLLKQFKAFLYKIPETVAKKMSDDIDEMERMLNEYLDFASEQKHEKTEMIDINQIIKNIVKIIK